MAGVARRYGGTRRLSLVVTLAAALVVLFALTPTGGANPARTAANRVTFEDSTGEDAQGPDITTVVLSNDDRGTLTWVINIPNRPTLTGDMAFLIFINSDSNSATGDPQLFGSDYILELDGPIGGPAQAGLFRWDGTDFTIQGVPQSSLIFGYANGAMTIRLNASELGNARRIQFLVLALTGLVLGPDGQLDDTNARFDVAPDPGRGMYSFDVRITPPRLVVRSFGLRPPTPRAGRPFSVFVTFARSDGTAPAAPSVTCRATLGGRALSPSGSSVAGRRATCRWALPGSARGQTIRGTVTVRSGGLRVSRPFSARVGS
jgi:hypothetical protein